MARARKENRQLPLRLIKPNKRKSSEAGYAVTPKGLAVIDYVLTGKISKELLPHARQTITPHLLPPPPKRGSNKAHSFAYSPPFQHRARYLAREEADKSGHEMTRFMHSQQDGYIRSVCRKCGLKVRDWNFQVDGPALLYECSRRGKDGDKM